MSSLSKAGRSLALLALACQTLLYAQPPAEAPPEPAQLSLPAAAQLALRFNPELAKFGYDRQALQGRQTQAGLRPNPELGLEFDNFAGSGAAREITLRLSQAIEIGGKRDARLNQSQRLLDRLDAEQSLAQLDVLAETTRRFIDVVETQQQLSLAEHGVDYAQQSLAAARRRVAVGAASSLEINRAQIAQERAVLEREHQEHLLSTLRRKLSEQWGRSEAQFESAQAQLLELPEVPDYSELLARLRRSPDFARFDLERRLREADLRLAQAKAHGDPVLSAGLRRTDSAGDVAMVASLLMPLPFANRNQGAIAEARALRGRVDTEQQAAQLRSEVVLYDMLQELRHARTVVESLQTTLLPQAEEALTLTRRGYANGRYSQLDLIDAQRTRLELERELIANAADYHRYLAAVERMTALAPAAAAP